ncbi:MAG: hypothetical protein KKD47_03225 [Proteobacteria bacterium]|nr:hypothetical protein [Pseudomonadota bacterium]
MNYLMPYYLRKMMNNITRKSSRRKKRAADFGVGEEMSMTKFFFVREETDTQVVYRLRNAWVPFVFAWVGIIGAACWFLATPPTETAGKIAFWIAGAFLLLRWVIFFNANREMLSAKYSGRMKVEGSKFSKTNPPVITIQKEGSSPTTESNATSG